MCSSSVDVHTEVRVNLAARRVRTRVVGDVVVVIIIVVVFARVSRFSSCVSRSSSRRAIVEHHRVLQVRFQHDFVACRGGARVQRGWGVRGRVLDGRCIVDVIIIGHPRRVLPTTTTTKV